MHNAQQIKGEKEPGAHEKHISGQQLLAQQIFEHLQSLSVLVPPASKPMIMKEVSRFL